MTNIMPIYFSGSPHRQRVASPCNLRLILRETWTCSADVWAARLVRASSNGCSTGHCYDMTMLCGVNIFQLGSKRLCWKSRLCHLILRTKKAVADAIGLVARIRNALAASARLKSLNLIRCRVLPVRYWISMTCSIQTVSMSQRCVPLSWPMCRDRGLCASYSAKKSSSVAFGCFANGVIFTFMYGNIGKRDRISWSSSCPSTSKIE